MSELLAFETKADSHLLCLLEGILLGVEALTVRELLPLPWITPVREAPPLVAGVVNVRGVLVPILDLNRALGLAPHRAQTSDVLVLLQREGPPVGIVVSEVRDVRSLGTGTTRAHADFSPALHGGSALVSGLIPVGDEIVQLLRLETLFNWGATSAVQNSEEARTESITRFDFEASPSREIEQFRERARNLSQNFETAREAEAQQMRPLAAFNIDGELFGLDLSVVREFALLRAVAPVPCSPSYIVGLMNLRGETLTLINISAPLGLSRAPLRTEKTRVVVVQYEGLRLGIVVDELLDIVSVNTNHMTQPGAQTGAASDDAVRGVVRGTVFFRDKMLGVLDLQRLLQSEALAES